MWLLADSGLTPTDITGIALAAVAVLGLPATYWQLRRSTRKTVEHSTDARWDEITDTQAQMIKGLRAEMDEAKEDCDERIDRVRREAKVHVERATRLLDAANEYIATLERRILDVTVGGRQEDLLAELAEHSEKIRQAKQELGLPDLP